MILNTSVVDREPTRTDIKVAKVDANKIAEEIGNLKIANMVALGAYLAMTGAVSTGSIEKALRKKLTGKKVELIDLNLKAIEAGMRAVKD